MVPRTLRKVPNRDFHGPWNDFTPSKYRSFKFNPPLSPNRLLAQRITVMTAMRFPEADEVGLETVSFDGEEINIHDQLPSPEEIKSDIVGVRTRNVCRICRVLLVSALLLASIFAIIGVVVRAKKNSPATKRWEETLAFLANYTDAETLSVFNSPQRRAAIWMAHEDTLMREIPVVGEDEWKFLQRYALVVLYFATQDNGPWKYPQLFFAAPKKHECNWNYPFQRANDGSTFSMGAICNDEKQVTKLILGKFAG